MRHFLKLTTCDVGHSGGRDVKNPNFDSYMAQISPKIANFDDFGQNYRPPVVGDYLKWSVGANKGPPFFKINRLPFGNSGGRRVKNPNPDSYMAQISPKIANFDDFGPKLSPSCFRELPKIVGIRP